MLGDTHECPQRLPWKIECPQLLPRSHDLSQTHSLAVKVDGILVPDASTFLQHYSRSFVTSRPTHCAFIKRDLTARKVDFC